MSKAPIILSTFALSHFCENARWALDYKGVSYTEESWAPVLHFFRTWHLQKTHTPVLRIDGKVIQESAEICEYLEKRFPERSLIPVQLREEVLGVAQEARSIGPHVRRLAYWAIGQELELLEQAWALNVGPAEARIQQLVFPLSRRMAFKGMQVSEQATKESEALVRDFLDARNAQFVERDGYLVGDRFTLADLTMASILSPLARPQEHPFYARMAMGKAAEALLESFRSDLMIAWVKDCYARHRSPGVRM
ncbi:MAG: glutathione S-transferase family protein [Polyangiales bacterium]